MGLSEATATTVQLDADTVVRFPPTDVSRKSSGTLTDNVTAPHPEPRRVTPETATLFVATPSHDGSVSLPCAAGFMQALQAFPGRIRIEAECGSFLPRNRDILTARFLESRCTHLLCVDSDIGWRARDVQRLLETGKWFVSGAYAKKQPDRSIPADFTGDAEGVLARCRYVPAGFLLLARPAVVAMVDAYPELGYENRAGMKLSALWSSLFVPGGSYDGEDVAFCRRWTALGGQIWMHMGVVLRHMGTNCYLPRVESL